MSYLKALPVAVIVVTCTATGGRLAATAQKDGQSPPGPVMLSVPGAPVGLLLQIEPLRVRENQLMFYVQSSSADGCKYPQGFEIPVQINETSFQLKRMLRASQNRDPDGSCVEGFATVYWFDDFRHLKSAESVVLHLPTGAISLPKDALAYIKSFDTGAATPSAAVDPALYLNAVGVLNDLIQTGRTKEALEGAERIAPTFATRPAEEGFAFFATFGMARRNNNDLDGAARCYDIALMIASAAHDTSAKVGIVYDNLATVRRLQGRLDEARSASDLALATLEQTLGVRHGTYGGALNNRALILMAAGDPTLALDYSERALSVLREAFNGDKAALEPFLEDNRIIRAKLPRE
jgi:tetratricopeptide (TPR) repeat protein